MEFMLRWWDEFDDTVDASRRVLADALAELGSIFRSRFNRD
jgi:hypothetical protein